MSLPSFPLLIIFLLLALVMIIVRDSLENRQRHLIVIQVGLCLAQRANCIECCSAFAMQLAIEVALIVVSFCSRGGRSANAAVLSPVRAALVSSLFSLFVL